MGAEAATMTPWHTGVASVLTRPSSQADSSHSCGDGGFLKATPMGGTGLTPFPGHISPRFPVLLKAVFPLVIH